MKKLRAHHIHHVPKWPSYFCKIWALGVSQIYMVYIFTCLFRVSTTINLSHHGHIKSGPMKEEVFLKRVSLINSLSNIKHTSAWRDKFVVYIYIYIYIAQNLLKIKQSEMDDDGKICQKHKMSIFSYSLLSKILKLRRSSLRLVFLIKIVYNQFLLFKNYSLWHWIRSFMWFILTNLESVIFD